MQKLFKLQKPYLKRVNVLIELNTKKVFFIYHKKLNKIRLYDCENIYILIETKKK